MLKHKNCGGLIVKTKDWGLMCSKCCAYFLEEKELEVTTIQEIVEETKKTAKETAKKWRKENEKSRDPQTLDRPQ